ncbi:hypothetical protein M9H77_12938 [Catharanthus roseus]|uniref:Uncharacterized protein n=1 Tax=Catharanthus roseus TaxID=4058 RepID=A0ACC0BIR0_CATRO|nr:hypothetical protein M9H77_12938 [Catharanthus roseus]
MKLNIIAITVADNRDISVKITFMRELDHAKFLLMQDPNYNEKGFKFDHVWNIAYDFKKFTDQTAKEHKFTDATLQTQVLESPGISDFEINLSDDIIGGSSSRRPIRVKKAKLKRKIEDKTLSQINDLREEI